MIFCTYWFVVCLALMLPVYWLLRKPNLRLLVLMIFCLVFHAHFAGPAGVLPIVVLAAITYFVGRSGNKSACVWAIAVCVTALVFYKYIHFFTQQMLRSAFSEAAAKFDATLVNVLPGAPPLAISFFTFEFVHYLYEVRRGHPPIKSLADFAQFTFFFPSLVAGPIKRYEQFIPSLREGLRKIRSSDVAAGLFRVIVGFIKKSLIADNLTAYITQTDPYFAQLSISDRWFLLGAIALRIYMDFSGYTDMAIGLAQMLGIHLPANFNWPYLAKNIQDFWQRWHISLSTWIRDYVYIPLGGNRLGPARRIVNGLLAFALCGLWHGAAWNFVFWGLYHGVGLAVCSSYRKALGPVGRLTGTLFDRFSLVSWAVTMLYVGIGWLLFFYPLNTALQMTRLLFTKA
ncbi:MAG: MBOAT family protein [Cyanobacteria bacterium SZAS-4]|nr:MBOAT family protein [Cyanobacteria bacterium SZAS-4]